MSGLLRVELKKLFYQNVWLYVVLLMGCAVAVISAVQSIFIYEQVKETALLSWGTKDMLYSAVTVYAFWLPTNIGSFYSSLFYMVWPLLSALAYSWSLCGDLQSKSLYITISKSSVRRALSARLISTFFAGSLVVAVPLIINFTILCCFVPASPLFIGDVLYTGIHSYGFLSWLLYQHPLMFCAAWLMFSIVISGLWSLFIALLSYLVDSFTFAFIGSYLSVLLVSFITSNIGSIVAPLINSNGIANHIFQSNIVTIIRYESYWYSGLGTAIWTLVLLALVLVSAYFGWKKFNEA